MIRAREAWPPKARPPAAITIPGREAQDQSDQVGGVGQVNFQSHRQAEQIGTKLGDQVANRIGRRTLAKHVDINTPGAKHIADHQQTKGVPFARMQQATATGPPESAPSRFRGHIDGSDRA